MERVAFSGQCSSEKTMEWKSKVVVGREDFVDVDVYVESGVVVVVRVVLVLVGRIRMALGSADAVRAKLRMTGQCWHCILRLFCMRKAERVS
jgi:hypothetical protein